MTKISPPQSLPIHALSSPEAFSAAAHLLLLDAKANESQLAYGALLLIHDAFSRMPKDIRAIFEVNLHTFSMQSLELRAPPDVLTRDEDGYVYFHNDQEPSGWTPTHDFDELTGPDFDISEPTWIHPALEEAIAPVVSIRRALEILAKAAPPLERPRKIEEFKFRTDSTSIQMFADLFGFQGHIAKAESSILDHCANSTDSTRKTPAL